MRKSRCKRGAHVRALRRAVASVITDDRDKHFDKCGCRCHCLPAQAPHLQDKCASVSYVSPCSIVAIIITSQSCALTIGLQVQSFNSDSHLHYTHGARSTLRALAVPGRRVPSRYPIPRREACSRPGLTITRQRAIWAHWHLAPPLPSQFSQIRFLSP